ncbi:hypothetical protein CHARACLAT_003932 [Characodon lateralis]|uniref:Uncharacterized protein n=1 Tax=Characodon lateralis TaxID=208331 RepID=A0ABU7EG68_9TELE|nr:hypothetical protein [Characodon lateralis]
MMDTALRTQDRHRELQRQAHKHIWPWTLRPKTQGRNPTHSTGRGVPSGGESPGPAKQPPEHTRAPSPRHREPPGRDTIHWQGVWWAEGAGQDPT